MNQSIISINIIFKGNISALQNNPFSLDAPLDPSFQDHLCSYHPEIFVVRVQLFSQEQHDSMFWIMLIITGKSQDYDKVLTWWLPYGVQHMPFTFNTDQESLLEESGCNGCFRAILRAFSNKNDNEDDNSFCLSSTFCPHRFLGEGYTYVHFMKE